MRLPRKHNETDIRKGFHGNNTAVGFLPPHSFSSLDRYRASTSVAILRFYSMPNPVTILNAAAIQRALTRIAHEIAERNENSQELVLVGIQRGGVVLAERLSSLLAGIWHQNVLIGRLDVSMHRDDLNQRLAPDVHPTVIPFDVTGKTVVLVDDVLFSGRTTRAAMDALNDFGRPTRIQLAVLIDRGHRELPIKADFVGKNLPTAADENVVVRLAEPDAEDAVLVQKQ